MAKAKYDGVVEAVRYQPDGLVAWVRAYERRGPTWSDHRLIHRQALIESIKSGKKYVAGKRVPRMAGTFETQAPIKLVRQGERDLLMTTENSSGHDILEGVPVV